MRIRIRDLFDTGSEMNKFVSGITPRIRNTATKSNSYRKLRVLYGTVLSAQIMI
jgi:hypothetical protein